MNRLNEIVEYLYKKGYEQKEVNEGMHHSVYLSMFIAEYAHRNQFRENGEEYINHPLRCLDKYRNLVGIELNDPFCIDIDLMYECGVPYDGVQEVCLMHDVLEDTDFTIEEIEEIFDECELGNYFRLYIKDALLRITHDKNVDYFEYVETCLKNPISAMVKFMDLQDNLNVLSLKKFDKEYYERTVKYITCMYFISEVSRFLERVNNYKEVFKKEDA